MTYIVIDKRPPENLALRYFSPAREARKKAHIRDWELNGKYCKYGDHTVPLSEFYGWSASGLSGYSSYCRKCLSKYSLEKRWKRRERSRRQ